jgi:hypothetical protein
MGNSEAVCKWHYLETLTREEGAAWFKIRRSKAGAEPVSMVSAAPRFLQRFNDLNCRVGSSGTAGQFSFGVFFSTAGNVRIPIISRAAKATRSSCAANTKFKKHEWFACPRKFPGQQRCKPQALRADFGKRNRLSLYFRQGVPIPILR